MNSNFLIDFLSNIKDNKIKTQININDDDLKLSNKIFLKKSEKGTHTKMVTVHRGGKVFKRKQRVGRKESKKEEIKEKVKDDIFDDFFNLEIISPETKKDKYIKDISDKVQIYTNKIIKNNSTSNYINSVRDYLTDEYLNINRYLKQSNIKNDKIDIKINNISNFLKGAPKFKGIVYRGMSYPKNEIGLDKFNSFINEIKNNDKIILPSFTSTSISSNAAGRFTKDKRGIQYDIYSVLFEIKSKNGVLLDNISSTVEEKEVLFDHHTQFLIQNISKENNITKIILEEI